MEWLRKFFSEPGTLATMVGSAFVGFCFSIANGIVQKKHGGWESFFSALATGTVIAVMVGLGISEYIKSEALRYAIIGACALVSEDIWAGLRALGRLFREDPLGAVSRFIDALRGKSVAAPTKPAEE